MMQQGGHHALAHAGVATAPDMMQQRGHHTFAHAGVATAPDMMQQGGHHALAHAGVVAATRMMHLGVSTPPHRQEWLRPLSCLGGGNWPPHRRQSSSQHLWVSELLS